MVAGGITKKRFSRHSRKNNANSTNATPKKKKKSGSLVFSAQRVAGRRLGETAGSTRVAGLRTPRPGRCSRQVSFSIVLGDALYVARAVSHVFKQRTAATSLALVRCFPHRLFLTSRLATRRITGKAPRRVATQKKLTTTHSTIFSPSILFALLVRMATQQSGAGELQASLPHVGCDKEKT